MPDEPTLIVLARVQSLMLHFDRAEWPTVYAHFERLETYLIARANR